MHRRRQAHNVRYLKKAIHKGKGCLLFLMLMASLGMLGCGRDRATFTSFDAFNERNESSDESKNTEVVNTDTEASDLSLQGEDLSKEEPVSSIDVVTVHIVGEVAHPGIYQMHTGERLIDAIVAAGGFTTNAYTDELSLATLLEDGMRIDVFPLVEGNHNQIPIEQLGLENVVQGERAQSENITIDEGKVSLNTATIAELTTLSGIGPSKAQAIIDYRETYGPFSQISDVTKVSGIGQSTYQKIQNQITINH